MAEESVLLAEPKPAPTAPVAIVSAEAIFRSRLEAGLEGGYRLASVILGDRSEAEDATHDAAERAWRSRSSLRDIERFDAWFQRIIVNACRDRMRSRRSTTMLVSVDGAGGSPRTALADPTSDPFSSSLERDALLQALRLLNPDQRIVVVLRFYLDLEIDEIARRLGTRSGTVKSRLHRGLKRLRAAWEAQR